MEILLTSLRSIHADLINSKLLLKEIIKNLLPGQSIPNLPSIFNNEAFNTSFFKDSKILQDHSYNEFTLSILVTLIDVHLCICRNAISCTKSEIYSIDHLDANYNYVVIFRLYCNMNELWVHTSTITIIELKELKPTEKSSILQSILQDMGPIIKCMEDDCSSINNVEVKDYFLCSVDGIKTILTTLY